jgi:micrococcal nuclease
MFTYKALITEVYDGDTCTADIDLGFYIHHKQRLRLLGINTPELKGLSKVQGIASRDRLRELILGKTVYIQTQKDDAFGRWLADIYLSPVGDRSVNEQMIAEGYAVKYFP